VSDYDVVNNSKLTGRKSESDASAVNCNAIVDKEGGQTLELRLSSGAARQKPYPHRIASVPQRYPKERERTHSYEQIFKLIVQRCRGYHLAPLRLEIIF